VFQVFCTHHLGDFAGLGFWLRSRFRLPALLLPARSSPYQVLSDVDRHSFYKQNSDNLCICYRLALASSWTVIVPVSTSFSGRSGFCSAVSLRRSCLMNLIFTLSAAAAVTGNACPVRAAFCLGGRAMDRLTCTAVFISSSPSSKSSSSFQ